MMAAENLAEIALHPRQVLVLASELKLSVEDLDKISAFLVAGGLVLSHNKAVETVRTFILSMPSALPLVQVGKLFPGAVTFQQGESHQDKETVVQINEQSADRYLLAGT